MKVNTVTCFQIFHFNHKFILYYQAYMFYPGIDIVEDFRKAEDLDIEDNGFVTRIKLCRHKKGIRTLQFMKPLATESRFFSITLHKLGKKVPIFV